MSSGHVNKMGRNELFAFYQMELLDYVRVCTDCVRDNQDLPWPPLPYSMWAERERSEKATIASIRSSAIEQCSRAFSIAQKPAFPRIYDHMHTILEGSTPHDSIPGSLFAQLMNIAHRYSVGFCFTLVNRSVVVDSLEFGPDFLKFESKYSDPIPCLCVSYFSTASVFMSTIAGHIDSGVHRLMPRFNATLLRNDNLVLTREMRGKILSTVSHVIEINPVSNERSPDVKQKA